MNFEQILIRLGVDMSAVKTGLGKAGAYIKAWGVSVFNDLKGQGLSMMKGFLGAEAVIRGIGKFKEILGDVSTRILKIKKDSLDTGLSTNFIQELYKYAESRGVPFEMLVRNLLHFNQVIGAAKIGSREAREKLIQFGIATKGTSWSTLNLKDSLNKLRELHISTADAAARNYRENELLGKGYKALTPLLEQSAEAFKEMDQDSFFSKINTQTINTFSGMFGSKVSAQDVARSTFANSFATGVANAVGIALGQTGKTITEKAFQFFEIKGGIANIAEAQQAADQQDIMNLEQKNTLAAELISKTGELKDLTAEIADRDKESVSSLAAKARKITGIKSPEEMQRTVTPAMRQALKIDTLEQRARIRQQYGDTAGVQRLQSQADQIRAANPLFFKAQDQDPMERTRRKIDVTNLLLVPVSKMADMVNSQSK
jgi:hypothetical protein